MHGAYVKLITSKSFFDVFLTTHRDTIVQKKQWSAEFSTLIFNFCCLLHVSNLLGTSSGRQLYTQYGMLYVHRCEHFVGLSCIITSKLCPRRQQYSTQPTPTCVRSASTPKIISTRGPIRHSKGKAIPLQAWTGPEGSRRLRLQDSTTIGTWRR